MTIQEFDLQIAELEQTLLDLKRRRNTHLPIHQLPTEILGEIFSFASGMYDSWAGRQKAKHPVVPIPVLLCHVCHSWREFVLRSPSHWTNIYFGPRTTTEMADFMLENAGSNAPLRVQCGKSLQGPVARLAKATVSNTSQLQFVDLAFHSTSEGMLLLRPATGSAENLEYLKIAVEHRTDLEVAPFAGGVPKLRCLGLHHFCVPRTSHLFQSIYLNHLTMLPAFSTSAEPLQGFYNFLRRTPHLKTLHIAFPLDKDGLDTSPSCLFDTESEPIPLRDLEFLDISGRPAILCAVLGRLQFSTSNISHLGLDFWVSEGVETPGNSTQLLTAWRRAAGGGNSPEFRHTISAPECIRISTTQCRNMGDISKCGYIIQAWDTQSQNIPLSTLTGLRYLKTGLGYPPWAEVKIQCQDKRFFGDHPRERFPFPYRDTFSESGLWSLDNLRFVMINVSLSRSYWAAFSHLKVLEVIHVAAANVNGFVDLLEINSRQSSATPGTSTNTSTTLAGKFGSTQDAHIPFPALQSFVVTGMANFRSGVPEEARARQVMGALQKRRYALQSSGNVAGSFPKLDLLEFGTCMNKIDESTRSQMLVLATNAVWKIF